MPIVAVNGVELEVVEAGLHNRGPLVVLCHGFPELAYSWRHQIPALAEAGYRVVAPNQRGYGSSSRPADVDAYNMVHLTDDVIGLVDHYGADDAVLIGHDWGAPVVWNASQRFPDRVRAVVALSVPHGPRSPYRPTEAMKHIYGDNFFYVLYFQREGPADEELMRDVNYSQRAFIWTICGDAPDGTYRQQDRHGTLLGMCGEPPEVMPAWITAADVHTYVQAFEKSTFTGGLNWYRNSDRNWELSQAWADRLIDQPALFIGGDRDPVLRFTRLDGLADVVPELRGTHVLPGIGHWTQQEAPDECTALLLDFLAGV
jgi:pimeloyl-ACP methyl ester carboxylesterase